MRGDHDELKIFLEIRLIPSRINQKLRTKEGRIHGFKEKIRPGIVAIGSGRGCRLKATWERIFGRGIVALIPRKIRANWASNQPPKRPRIPPRLTTISARSGFDRASIVLLKLHRSSSRRLGSIPR